MKTTLQDIEKIDSSVLTINQVAPVLNSCWATIKKTLDKNPNALGFPTIKLGRRTVIPKQAFLKTMRGE